MTPLRLCQLADPKLGALPEDAAMTRVIEQATRPWCQKRHALYFPRGRFTDRIVLLLWVQWKRQQAAMRAAARNPRRHRHPEAKRKSRRLEQRHDTVAVGWLTPDMWLAVVPFMARCGV